MSQLPFAAPRQFQTPITQRHLETEVPHCVGGVTSPLLLNVALHGLEEAAGVRYVNSGAHAGTTKPDSPVVIRYADLCRARHKSAYADSRVMPRGRVTVQVSGMLGGLCSA
jgi:hypothetical protein